MRRGLIRSGTGAFALAALAVVLVVSAQPVTPVQKASAAGAPPRAGVSDLVPGVRDANVTHKAPAAAAYSGVRATPVLVIGSYQQVLINQDRAAAGLRPLTWNSCLLAVAVSNARRMAAQGYISHTNGAWLDLDCGLGFQGGENVGWWSGGIDDVQLNSMFMASPDHRANIMGPYHYVATAWAVGANGYAYIAVEFT